MTNTDNSKIMFVNEKLAEVSRCVKEIHRNIELLLCSEQEPNSDSCRIVLFAVQENLCKWESDMQNRIRRAAGQYEVRSEKVEGRS